MKKVLALLVIIALTVVVVGCGGGKDAPAFKDGTYEGSAPGFKGDVEVKVTVAGGKITKVEITKHGDTPGVSDPAIQQLPGKIVEKQGTEGIDAVSGATKTSEGILAAAAAALKNAKP
jgi:fumarate reductase flavoprotein subunit